MQAFDAVLANIQRSNFEQIYGNVKNLLCCNISDTSRLLWISWTVTGTIAGNRPIVPIEVFKLGPKDSTNYT